MNRIPDWAQPAPPAEIRAFIEQLLDDDPEILVEGNVDFEEFDYWLDAISELIASPSSITDATLLECWDRSSARMAIFDWEEPRRDLLLGTTWEFVRAFFAGEFSTTASGAVQ